MEALVYIIIIGGFFFSTVIEVLNLKNMKSTIPEEFVGFYDQKKYAKSQEYLRVNTRFGLLASSFSTLLLVLFIALGGFNVTDLFVRQYFESPIVLGIAYIGLLSFLTMLVGLPFGIYETFVIEERFGFNKTTPKTFVIDSIKSILMSVAIGAPVLAVVLWFFETFEFAWLWVFLFIVAFQLFMMFIAPVTIMPLFNKFEPLPDGELKDSIEAFAKKENFKLSGLFRMDGSKRSTKANAYFTGFGRFRRIVLFDTLIEKHSKEELVAILAHEIGHYKEKHIMRQLIVSTVSTGLMLFIFSLFINNEAIFAAFQMEHLSVYASFVFFGIFYSPISSLFSLYSLHLSRKYEFEADAYAVRTYGHPGALSEALKKLSVDNLSNMSPHPLKVFFEYTHPPVVQRIRAIQHSE